MLFGGFFGFYFLKVFIKERMIEHSKRCYRCENEFEKLYLVPYQTTRFIDVEICRECSMLIHKEVDKLINDFIFGKKVG